MILKTKFFVWIYSVIAGLSLLFFNGCHKKGCMAPCATNFEADAKEDDGNCNYSKPAGAVTSVLMDLYLIDFATGKIDSIKKCTARYEYDLLVTLGTSGKNLLFKTKFHHKAQGDITCNGDVAKWGDGDDGGTWASINEQPQPKDQDWNCKYSTKYEGDRAGVGGVSAQSFSVISTREGNFYKIYIDNIIYQDVYPVGVTITWFAMQK